MYYGLEAHGFDYPYRKVKKAVKRGRRAGYINPGQIVDTSRSAAWTATDGELEVRWADRTLRYDGREEFVENVVGELPTVYFEDFWKDQDRYVEVWLEKASLASVFHPICRAYNVHLEATRGDWTDGRIYPSLGRVAERLTEGDDVRILYFGDFNPSGYHAPVAVQSTMAAYGLKTGRKDVDSSYAAYFDIWPRDKPIPFVKNQAVLRKDGGSDTMGTRSTLAFERIALNREHVERFDLPENPTPSKSDKDRTIRDRFMQFVSDGRDVNIELNALKEFQREELETMIEDAIEQHVDSEARDQFEARVEQTRADLADDLEGIDD